MSTPASHFPEPRGHARTQPAALRHRGQPVRRPRRGHQHHAPADPGAGRGSRPPRPQPLGRGRGARRAAGRRRRHRAVAATRAATSNTSSTWSTCCASAAPATSACSAAAAAPSRRKKSRELQDYGVERIYHPNDGMHMGLVAMIEDLVARTHEAPRCRSDAQPRRSVDVDDEISDRPHALRDRGRRARRSRTAPHLRKEWQLAGGKTPGGRPHRHRRRRQVLGHRRTAEPLPAAASRRCASP